MTALRRQTVFASLDPPPAWPATRGRPRPARLDTELDALPGVGATLKRKLAKLGLETLRDLLEHRPRRYESAVDEVAIAALGGSEEVAIAGEVLNVSSRRRGRLKIVTARISDGTASVAATWFNQPWLEEQLRPGVHVRLRGKPGRYGFDVKSYDVGDGEATADFAPVYPASEEIPPKRLRTLVGHALGHVADYFDPLPAELRERREMPLKRDGEPGELIERYRGALPFSLTPYQEQAVREIDADLARTIPMQRLLQGDVGSGKTVVALYALLRAVEHRRQGALMAPTETLAEQHFLTIEGICAELGVTCALLTSASPKKVRTAALSADVVVGTHALIQEGVELRDLAVAVVDEQHRFGVEQRKALAQGRAPHVLHMTATPIPRTLALTVYGDLAVSEIAKPPASRRPIVTRWIPEERASEAYTRLARLLREGRQAYVVCPLVEASETTLARAAEEEAERLRRAELREFKVGCMHGRLKPDERRDVMARFKARELDVLVATTVIEVGVDVPNATVMIVQEADRFGLAQLHQLRGRVGRGGEQSYCLLVSREKEELTETAVRRLESLVATTDGFELAEVDLDLRGGGQLLGTRQHGVSDLRFAHIRRDRPLLEQARKTAQELGAATGPLVDEINALFAETDSGALA